MHRSACLWLIRHAQSQNNAQEDRFRVPDPDITEIGIVQAKKLANSVAKLAPTVVYCSPFLRSLETTRWMVQSLTLTPRIRQDIYEQGGCHSGYLPNDRLAVAGMSRELLSTRYCNWRLDDRITDRGWYDLDHYETDEEVRQRARRVRAWFEAETNEHTSTDRVAMVIHADFKVRLLEAFLDDEHVESQIGDIVNTAITQLSKVDGRWRVDYWNDFAHLDAHEVTC